MATGGDLQADYGALVDARAELVGKLAENGADPDTLVAEAKERGVIGSIQASAAVAMGRRERLGQLVDQVFDAAKTDGGKVAEFAQLLEEHSLKKVAAFLREKLEEYSTTHTKTHQHSQRPRRGPDAGHGDRPPKLEAVSVEDSGIASHVALKNDSVSPEVDRTQHRPTTTDASGTASFKSVPGGLVYAAEQEPTDNLQVDSDNPVESVRETQPHTEESLPTTGASSVPVLPETKSLLQTNQDLQAQLAEKTVSEKKLQDELERTSNKKREVEMKLKEKERELKEKDSQMKKEVEEKESEIRQLKKKVGHLQQELQNEKENNQREKRDLEEKIRDLEGQLLEKEAKFNEEKFQLMNDKHKLELQVQRMRTEEERLKGQIMEQKCKVAELHAQAERDKTERTVSDLKWEYEQQMEKMRLEHQNSMSEKELQHQNSMSEKDREITEMHKEIRRRNSTMEPDIS